MNEGESPHQKHPDIAETSTFEDCADFKPASIGSTRSNSEEQSKKRSLSDANSEESYESEEDDAPAKEEVLSPEEA